jgi:hypothetical protein
VLNEGLTQDPFYGTGQLYKDIVKSFEESGEGINGLQRLLRDYFQMKIEKRDSEDQSELNSLRDDTIEKIRSVFIPWDEKRFAKEKADKVDPESEYANAEYKDRITKALQLQVINKRAESENKKGAEIEINKGAEIEINTPMIKDAFLEKLRTVFKTVKVAPLNTKSLQHQLTGEKSELFNKFKAYVKQNDELKKFKLELELKKIMPESLKGKFQQFIDGEITERDIAEAIRLS